jgi:HSP20 family protein
MNLVTVNPRHRRVTRRPSFGTPVFDNLLNELINGNFSNPKRNSFTKNRPAVNVIESNDHFKIEIAVPGLTKKDINIIIEKDVLTISASKEVKLKEGEKYTRKEFSYDNFKRTFQLPETVDAANIKATFKNGILEVAIAKKEEAKELPPRAVEIK